jgi:hypothetical protein
MAQLCPIIFTLQALALTKANYVANAQDAASITAGFPLLDVTVSYSDITDQAVLNELALRTSTGARYATANY